MDERMNKMEWNKMKWTDQWIKEGWKELFECSWFHELVPKITKDVLPSATWHCCSLCHIFLCVMLYPRVSPPLSPHLSPPVSQPRSPCLAQNLK
jgi:hypothetical protein